MVNFSFFSVLSGESGTGLLVQLSVSMHAKVNTLAKLNGCCISFLTKMTMLFFSKKIVVRIIKLKCFI